MDELKYNHLYVNKRNDARERMVAARNAIMMALEILLNGVEASKKNKMLNDFNMTLNNMAISARNIAYYDAAELAEVAFVEDFIPDENGISQVDYEKFMSMLVGSLDEIVAADGELADVTGAFIRVENAAEFPLHRLDVGAANTLPITKPNIVS